MQELDPWGLSEQHDASRIVIAVFEEGARLTSPLLFCGRLRWLIPDGLGEAGDTPSLVLKRVCLDLSVRHCADFLLPRWFIVGNTPECRFWSRVVLALVVDHFVCVEVGALDSTKVHGGPLLPAACSSLRPSSFTPTQ